MLASSVSSGHILKQVLDMNVMAMEYVILQQNTKANANVQT